MEKENNVDLTELTYKSPRHSKRGKKHTLLWVVLGIIAALIIAVVIVVSTAVADYKGTSRNGDICEVIIPEGAAVSTIASLLEDAGAIDNALLFRIYSRLADTETLYQYGTYEFKNDIGFEAIANLLITQGTKAKTKTVVIPEGTGINDYTKDVNGKDVTVPGIATLLEKAGVCTKEDFFAALDEVALDSRLLKNANKDKAYEALEGYLFPDTYEFYFHDSKECARLAIERMIARSEERITDEMYDRAEKMGCTMNEILTMASIIQMESGQNGDEMANVAAVFYNRLKSDAFPTLGSSPTCYYGSFNPDDDDRYDTYKIKGLPPGPLCSSGIEAINAALYPSENFNYYYFVTDSKGKFYYHKTSAEQSATINRLQQEGNWIYEYFK